MYRFNEAINKVEQKNEQNLNTTNVSVQLQYKITSSFSVLGFKYNKCIGSIRGGKRIGYDVAEFKYNKCIGSIHNEK